MKPKSPAPPTAVIPRLFHVIGPLPLPDGFLDAAVQNFTELGVVVRLVAGFTLNPVIRKSDVTLPSTVRDIINNMSPIFACSC